MQEGQCPQHRKAWNTAVQASLQESDVWKALRLLFDKGTLHPLCTLSPRPCSLNDSLQYIPGTIVSNCGQTSKLKWAWQEDAFVCQGTCR